jgi:hypothetical protein
MSEMRMLIVPAHLIKKIDENRGDLSQWEFLDFLIDSHLKAVEHSDPAGDHGPKGGEEYVTREMLTEFEHGMKELMRNFLDFVVTYGLEMARGPVKKELDALSRKLQDD